MLRILLLSSALLLAFTCLAQNKTFDSVLAKKTGADEYGMKQYVVS